MAVVQTDSSNFLSSQEKGNNNAQWWQAQVMSTLGADRWMRVGLRQLSGMLVMVFALSSLSVRSCSNALFASFSYMQQRLHHMPVCCGTSSVHGAVKHTLCSCNKGCIMLVAAAQATCMVLCMVHHQMQRCIDIVSCIYCTVAKRPLLLSHGVNAADSIPNFMQPSSASCAPALLHRYKCSCFLIPHEPCLFHCFI